VRSSVSAPICCKQLVFRQDGLARVAFLAALQILVDDVLVEVVARGAGHGLQLEIADGAAGQQSLDLIARGRRILHAAPQKHAAILQRMQIAAAFDADHRHRAAAHFALLPIHVRTGGRQSVRPRARRQPFHRRCAARPAHPQPSTPSTSQPPSLLASATSVSAIAAGSLLAM
jgi:hypothetical protein